MTSWGTQRYTGKEKDYDSFCIYIYIYMIHIYSGITSGRVLNGELLYTKILEVNMFAFAYRLCHEDSSSIIGDFCIHIYIYIYIYIYRIRRISRLLVHLYCLTICFGMHTPC